MLVKNILGNIEDYDIKAKAIDKVKLTADDRLKQIIRLTSDSGIEIGINLDGKHLHDGDVLAENEYNVFVVEFLPQTVLVIKPIDITQMGFIAHSIGNKHIPSIFESGVIIIEDDYLMVNWLREVGISFEKKEFVLKHPLKHASHHH